MQNVNLIFNKQAITSRLIALGWAVDPAVPGYALADVLRRFQQAHFTPDGLPLAVDGEWGPQTEAALFETYIPHRLTLVDAALAVARSQVGITEVPLGSNSGPQIRLVLKSVGLGVGYPYCAAGMHWTFGQAARMVGLTNPNPAQAGVLSLWELAGYEKSGLQRITAAEARQRPALIKPGMQGLLKLGATIGHTFLNEVIGPVGKLTTIEFNTSSGASREGTGVYRLNRRSLYDASLLGFINYDPA